MQKPFFLVVCLSLSSLIAHAQPAKRTSAYNYLTYGELNNAKNAIDEAITHEATINDAKTWYFRGQIYHAIYQSKEEKYKTLDPQAIIKAAEAYKRCAELDKKKDYTDDLKNRIKIAENQMMNEGIGAYNKEQFGDALLYFESSYELSKHPLSARLDTQAVFNAALVAEKIKNYEKAQKSWEEVIRLGYGKGKSYLSMVELLKSQGKEEEALAMAKKGRAQYPDDASLIVAELNFYLSSGKDKEAEQSIALALEKDPNNKNLHFALGTISNNLANPKADKPQPTDAEYKGHFEKAEKSYLKALEIDPSYFDAVYNLGALYFNAAVKVIEAAVNIKDNKLYEAEKQKADAIFAKSLPYLEKAYTLDPNDVSTLQSLKSLYARTGNNDKYAEINAKIKALQQK